VILGACPAGSVLDEVIDFQEVFVFLVFSRPAPSHSYACSDSSLRSRALRPDVSSQPFFYYETESSAVRAVVQPIVWPLFRARFFSQLPSDIPLLEHFKTTNFLRADVANDFHIFLRFFFDFRDAKELRE
jgi:hypothetical protein